VDVWQIGAEQGYLAAPFQVTNAASTSPLNNYLLMAPAERADIIVDFTGLAAGTVVRLINIAPDEPFGGFDPTVVADPNTTGQVMEFRVGALVGVDTSTPPAQLVFPAIPLPPVPVLTRPLSLNEAMSAVIMVPFDLAADAPVLLAVDATGVLVVGLDGKYVPDPAGKLVQVADPMAGVVPAGMADPTKLPDGVTPEMFGPSAAFMGIMDPMTGEPVPIPWMDAVTETPGFNTSEVWEFHNFTADAHPVHIHLVQFQVINREPLGNTDPTQVRPPEGWETGYKDTVISYPGEVTRVQATFDLRGRYVWHCHIVEHEDNEMMRPFDVV
jgi:FtsP/CotA-like multicopper oxidase with cupredoxin domain